MTGQRPATLLRLARVVAAAVLAVVPAGCANDSTDSNIAQPRLSRPCKSNALRLHGGFSRALGSQFAAITISTRAAQTCQIRGGRPTVMAFVEGKRVDLKQAHTASRQDEGPRVLTIPAAPDNSGPGFRFEWLETCLPKGKIVLVVVLPQSTAQLPVTHEDALHGPRCARGTPGTVTVSLLGSDITRLPI